jgi:tetratricopeptide (TPR) repeat protein
MPSDAAGTEEVGTFQEALRLYRQGGRPDAEALLARLLERQPDHFDALYLMGLIALQSARAERAAAFIERAVRINPAVAAAFRHLGDAFRDSARPAEALAAYAQALALRPNFAIAHLHRGAVLMALHRAQDALADFDAAIAAGANDAAALTYRAAALIDLQRPSEALASCDRALALDAGFVVAHVNRAAASYLIGDYAAVLDSCDRALANSPDFAMARAYRAAAACALRRTDEALVEIDRAVALDPRSAFAHNVRCLVLLDLERAAEALISSDAAIALQPELADAHNNRGIALTGMHRFDAAIESFDRAIALRPDVREPYFNKACRLLMRGEYAAGWELYEKRGGAVAISAQAAAGRPDWNGVEPIDGRIFYTHAEQGLGDTLQFCRYAKLLEARGARVILSVQSGLRTLLGSLGSAIRVIGPTEDPGAFDHHCALLSLPRVLGTRVDTIPADVPYLAAEPARVVHWRERLGTQGFRIGIRWQGSQGRVDIGRSFPVRHFEAIATIPGVRLISLQKGPGSEQLEALPAGMAVEQLGADFEPGGPDDFLDVAAVMQSLDLVITSDTSIAHLAGALGQPTWVALKDLPDWRWMLEREDSPWYPTLRLFRQPAQGDWASVFERMHTLLSRRLSPSA